MTVLKLLRRIGHAIDRYYLKRAGATVIPGSEAGLLLLCYHPYHAQHELILDEQILIKPGALVGEFHLSNLRITEIAADPVGGSLEWRLLATLKTEFKTLATACVRGTIPETVQGFYGINVLAAGAKRLGFSLVPLPKGWSRWWLGFWESCLRLLFYSYQTKKKAALQRTMDPYEVWISRRQLINRYYQGD
jgi:hypothetical protein